MFEIIYRSSICHANLRSNPSRRLEKSGAYIALDRSEKSAVSYFNGLTIAKLVASRLFGVPWLMHLDVYREGGS